MTYKCEYSHAHKHTHTRIYIYITFKYVCIYMYIDRYLYTYSIHVPMYWYIRIHTRFDWKATISYYDYWHRNIPRLRLCRVSPGSPLSKCSKKSDLMRNCSKISWLVVSTTLKSMSQLGWLIPIYGKIKNVPNHQPVKYLSPDANHGAGIFSYKTGHFWG